MLKALLGSAVALTLCAMPVLAQDTYTLDKIKAKNSITVGTREGSIGFNYIDDNNNQAGYSWEITMHIVEAVKKKLELPDLQMETLMVSPATRIQLVANQTLDLECSSTTHNLEREKQVSFSTTLFIVGPRLLVKKDSGIKDWADLKDKRVVVNAGTTAEKLLRQINSERDLGINILLSKEMSQAFMMVETDRADAAMEDDTPLYGQIARAANPDEWEVVGERIHKEAYGCMVRKDDAEFKALVDETITDMMKSGEMTKLYDKYFLQPIAVKGGITLNIPMSDEMKELYANPTDTAYQ